MGRLTAEHIKQIIMHHANKEVFAAMDSVAKEEGKYHRLLWGIYIDLLDYIEDYEDELEVTDDEAVPTRSRGEDRSDLS